MVVESVEDRIVFSDQPVHVLGSCSKQGTQNKVLAQLIIL